VQAFPPRDNDTSCDRRGKLLREIPNTPVSRHSVNDIPGSICFCSLATGNHDLADRSLQLINEDDASELATPFGNKLFRTSRNLSCDTEIRETPSPR
jgi:hypothetical protein